jgi:microcystin-dependent protein
MSSPFVAEIRVVGFNFAPTGWALCDGQILPISQNTALFSLLGTMYGGDGKSTFALPNLQDSRALSSGQLSGGNQYFEGENSGVPYVTLLTTEMPVHTHTVGAATDPAESLDPGPTVGLARSDPGNAWQTDTSTQVNTMDPRVLAVAGGSQPHNNMPPYLVLNFVIALQGVFPPRG